MKQKDRHILIKKSMQIEVKVTKKLKQKIEEYYLITIFLGTMEIT
ncbi:MAG: hypothetical protein ACMXYG_06135 [Candidatus Woesearchaeota archaeon]